MNRKSIYWQLPFLLLLIVGTIFVVRQHAATVYRQASGFVFGTVYNITYQHPTDLQPSIDSVLSVVDAEFSMFNERSTVARLNQGDTTVVLSPMFREVFRLASQVSADTEGAFDPTVAPLVNAWGFGFRHEQLPTAQQVDSLLAHVGLRHVALTADSLHLQKDHPDVLLDFSAIAKGFGSDCVARLLREHGVQNFMVEIGGEVVTQGLSAHNAPWRIGVTRPVDDTLAVDDQLQAVLRLTDRALATSGNYRNFYYQGGQKLAHTIDPLTGYPVQHSLLSATVLAPTCAMADAYATAFMVMGVKRARRLLDAHPELQAFLIYAPEPSEQNADSLAVWHSPGLPLLQ